MLKYGRKGYKNRKLVKRSIRRYKKPSMGSKCLVRLIKKVSLKKCETKETHRIEENIQIFHNTENIKYQLLFTQHGIGDIDTGTTSYDCRVGNEIVARGLSIKMWFANKLDRPNVMYKVIVFRYRADTTPTTIFKAQGTTNLMLRDIDTEKITILAVKQFNLNQGAAERIITLTDSFAGTEGHVYKKFWINLKNKQIQYIGNNSASPKYYDIGLCVVAYDSFGTLTTDNIASYAFNNKLYFKDP